MDDHAVRGTLAQAQPTVWYQTHSQVSSREHTSSYTGHAIVASFPQAGNHFECPHAEAVLSCLSWLHWQSLVFPKDSF